MVSFSMSKLVEGYTSLVVEDNYNLDDYYDLETSNLKIKDIISEFKHGNYSKEVGVLVSQALVDKYGENIKNYAFVTVPCSNRLRTEKKYKLFSKIVSSRTGMENGYNYVIRYRDSVQKHTTQNGGLNYYALAVDVDRAYNKKIILFDDFICSGSTVDYIKTRLKWYCKSVDCMFLERKFPRDEYLDSLSIDN